ncbi:MAG TPA: hypothetical protein VFY48_10560 [Solirubrobacterales bacterium]|nr:hypothetical protein [Solirubrobacterales bacterium]
MRADRAVNQILSAFPGRRRKLALASAAGLGATLLLAAVALAVGLGLQNRSFEQGLDHWSAKTLNSNRDVVYGPGGGKGSEVPGCDAPDAYGICVVEGADEFVVSDSDGTRTVTVNPLDGDKMLRLAGPFHDAGERQASEHIFQVSQEFVVDAAEPLITVNYDMFTFDYSGFDELRLLVKVFDDEGQVVNEVVQGGFSSGIDLKTTGWRGIEIDLSGYIGQQMSMQLEVQGTKDSLYGTWGYFDAGTAPVPPVSPGLASGTAPSGVNVNKQVNESGLFAFTMASFEVQNALNGDGCMPFVVSFPIDPGTATLSNVTLALQGQVKPMVHKGGDVWEAAFCIKPGEDGTLQLEYDATEEGVTQHFIVMVGEVVLIDPQGVVYDQQQFNEAKAAGKSDEQARAAAAITGATVRLQRETPPGSGLFINVLSADPGIAPNVNPQITGTDGRYQWDVVEGRYRVFVTAGGYPSVTSKTVDIPPPVTDLHIAMVRPGTGTGGQTQNTGSQGGASSSTQASVSSGSGKCAQDAGAAHRRALRKAQRTKKAGNRKAAAKMKKAAAKKHAAALKRCRAGGS